MSGALALHAARHRATARTRWPRAAPCDMRHCRTRHLRIWWRACAHVTLGALRMHRQVVNPSRSWTPQVWLHTRHMPGGAVPMVHCRTTRARRGVRVLFIVDPLRWRRRPDGRAVGARLARCVLFAWHGPPGMRTTHVATRMVAGRGHPPREVPRGALRGLVSAEGLGAAPPRPTAPQPSPRCVRGKHTEGAGLRGTPNRGEGVNTDQDATRCEHPRGWCASRYPATQRAERLAQRNSHCTLTVAIAKGIERCVVNGCSACSHEMAIACLTTCTRGM